MPTRGGGDRGAESHSATAVRGRLPAKPRQFVPRADFLAAMRGAPRIDWKELRADLDLFADPDPTPRGWGDC